MKKKLSIHSENILPIIKRWLYSDKEIFVRELISNSCDAIEKLKILRDQSQVDISDEEFRIDVTVDKEKKTITFDDTGIGMNAEEVEKYIAQIAFSGAEEFMEKYKSKQEIIGHFGLGFYSSYMVAEKVELQTLSYMEGSEPVVWSCDGSSDYLLEKGSRESRGTKITLFIDEEHQDYLDELKIKTILKKYCSYLPVPIFLNGQRVNQVDPLWLQKPSEITDKQYLEFYRELYPAEPDPIFWIHLNVDYPFHLKGILYFPKMTKKIDTQKPMIKLFCSRVFVSDNLKDLFPDYLCVMQGALDSPDIPLNVSRSYLQMDPTVKKLGAHISKKISDRLSSLYQSDREKYISYFPDLEMILKLGVLQDEKFYDRIQDLLLWKNLEGEWTNLKDYRERNPEKPIYYSKEAESSILNLYKEKGIEVILSHSMIDTPVFNFLESKLSGTHFQRTDGKLDSSLIDSSLEKTVLDEKGKTESANIADWIRSHLKVDDLEIEAKSLDTDKLPALYIIDEQIRRLRDYMHLTQSDNSVTLPSKNTFVVNTNHKLIQSGFSLREKNPELSSQIVRQVYDWTRLSQKELKPAEISDVVQRGCDLVEKLTHLACSSQ